MNSVEQKILLPRHGFPARINIRRVSQRQAGDAVRHLTMYEPQPSGATLAIGVASQISDQGRVEFVALANAVTVFCIRLDDKVGTFDKMFLALLAAGGEPLGDDEPKCCLVGFSMARTAVQIHHAVCRRVEGVDLATLSAKRGASIQTSPVEVVTKFLSQAANQWQIAQLWSGNEDSVTKNVCLQAWLAACVGQKNHGTLKNSVKVNTDFLTFLELECVAQIAIQSDMIENQKPKEFSNDFDTVTSYQNGEVEITNSRYKTRVRRNDKAQVIITSKSGHEYVGNARRSHGKRSTIILHGNHHDIQDVTNVRVIGRQEFTNSERAREELIHLLLTGQKTLLDSPFVRALWFPLRKEPKIPDPTFVRDHKFVDGITAKMQLNESQCRVVRGMVGDIPILVAHGPPGTGKTTTMAAASRIWDITGHYVWIVAHSNAAVKNIGETLFKKEVDFKLLISKEFFIEWHEHLYAEILQRVIRADELPQNVRELAKMMGGSRIILCTLSMLSNPALHTNGMFKIMPVERLLVDEASQINVFEFLPILKKFQQDLHKICFFGDPEQLPPFGEDKIPSIQTVFDLPHIATKDFFLDTQYRMPVPVANFISKAVYNNKLQSHHSITDPHCVKFINVNPPSAQETKSGVSWTNEAEVITIVHLIKYYYKNTNFCVITPYDAQRAAIERALKAERLPWGSVYNVDSFQGNEADYLLISVVRTGSHPGFLSSRKRMNVLLTRCRKANIVVTSKVFMALGGAHTLLGKMVSYWEKVLKFPWIWVDWTLVADGTVDLPDVPGPNTGCYPEASYLDTTPVTYLPRTSSKPNVPTAYRGSSGGFSVSALFKTPINPDVKTDQHKQPIQTYDQAFPPLAR